MGPAAWAATQAGPAESKKAVVMIDDETELAPWFIGGMDEAETKRICVSAASLHFRTAPLRALPCMWPCRPPQPRAVEYLAWLLGFYAAAVHVPMLRARGRWR